MIELHHGDCLNVLRGMKSGSVDAVITDPPYGIDFQSNRRTAPPRLKKIANDKQPFIWFLHDAFRVTKDGGCLLCFCRFDVQEVFRMAIEAAGFTIKSQVIWDRAVHGMGDLKAAFAPSHDIIWFATKGQFAFPGKRPKSVVRSSRVPSCHIVHPNEKPIDLMIQLVEAVTKEEATVLDCFMGSGTTGAACAKTGRRFIGIEMDQGYFKIANERIQGAVGGDFHSNGAGGIRAA